MTVSAAGTTNGVIHNCSDVAENTAKAPAFFGPIKIDKMAPACTVAVYTFTYQAFDVAQNASPLYSVAARAP